MTNKIYTLLQCATHIMNLLFAVLSFLMLLQMKNFWDVESWNNKLLFAFLTFTEAFVFCRSLQALNKAISQYWIRISIKHKHFFSIGCSYIMLLYILVTLIYSLGVFLGLVAVRSMINDTNIDDNEAAVDVNMRMLPMDNITLLVTLEHQHIILEQQKDDLYSKVIQLCQYIITIACYTLLNNYHPAMRGQNTPEWITWQFFAVSTVFCFAVPVLSSFLTSPMLLTGACMFMLFVVGFQFRVLCFLAEYFWRGKTDKEEGKTATRYACPLTSPANVLLSVGILFWLLVTVFVRFIFDAVLPPISMMLQTGCFFMQAVCAISFFWQKKPRELNC